MSSSFSCAFISFVNYLLYSSVYFLGLAATFTIFLFLIPLCLYILPSCYRVIFVCEFSLLNFKALTSRESQQFFRIYSSVVIASIYSRVILFFYMEGAAFKSLKYLLSIAYASAKFNQRCLETAAMEKSAFNFAAGAGFP